MQIADFIEANKERVLEGWKELVVRRLAFRLEESQLFNDLPQFVDELVAALRTPNDQWPTMGGARKHGRHRMRAGIDVGALTEEMAIITEAVCSLKEELGEDTLPSEVRILSRALARGASASVRAYAAMRDQELARQAVQHFSFVAHELRTPLHTATMAAALLRSGPAEQHPNYLTRLEKSLNQMAELVDHSLTQVRLTAMPEKKLTRFSVSELVQAACDHAIDHAHLKKLSLSIEVEEFELEADRNLLLSALSNLLKNAVKFTAKGKAIVIRAHADGASAVFEVEDACGGMPKDLPPRLFQPFLQEHDDKSGFGLGLMIVKQAAEAHQGSVRVTNHDGKGCSFVVEVPLSQSPDSLNGD